MNSLKPKTININIHPVARDVYLHTAMILGVIFVMAKIFGVGVVATWSWWLVLLPFYFGAALGLAFALFVVALVAIGYFIYGIYQLFTFIHNKLKK